MKRISELIEVLENYRKLYGNVYLSYDKVEDYCYLGNDFISDFNLDDKPSKIGSISFYDRKLASKHSNELVLNLSYICNM